MLQQHKQNLTHDYVYFIDHHTNSHDYRQIITAHVRVFTARPTNNKCVHVSGGPSPSGGGVGFVAAAEAEAWTQCSSVSGFTASTSLHALQFFAESVQSVFDDVQLVPDVLHHAVDVVGVLQDVHALSVGVVAYREGTSKRLGKLPADTAHTLHPQLKLSEPQAGTHGVRGHGASHTNLQLTSFCSWLPQNCRPHSKRAETW